MISDGFIASIIFIVIFLLLDNEAAVPFVLIILRHTILTSPPIYKPQSLSILQLVHNK
jgi:hypothetical protein